MASFKPQTHQRMVEGAFYSVKTSSHPRGISIAVTVPGMGPEEDRNRAYVTEAEALVVADGIARVLLYQGQNLDVS